MRRAEAAVDAAEHSHSGPNLECGAGWQLEVFCRPMHLSTKTLQLRGRESNARASAHASH